MHATDIRECNWCIKLNKSDIYPKNADVSVASLRFIGQVLYVVTKFVTSKSFVLWPQKSAVSLDCKHPIYVTSRMLLLPVKAKFDRPMFINSSVLMKCMAAIMGLL